MNPKLGSTETLEITFFLLISSDLCHKKMLLESLNIPLIFISKVRESRVDHPRKTTFKKHGPKHVFFQV